MDRKEERKLLLRMGNKECKELKKREESMLKNGSLLLEKLISNFNGKYSNPIRIFSAKELQKAAGNYSGNLVFNHDELCNSKWYNGFLEGQVISVRRYFGVLYTEYVINEFCLVAQMSAQKSVLKLLGCCLGTEIPILVYEFSANRNLVDHLHRRQGVQSFIIMEEYIEDWV